MYRKWLALGGSAAWRLNDIMALWRNGFYYLLRQHAKLAAAMSLLAK